MAEPTPFNDPHWPRASAWLAGEHLAETSASLAVIGAPLNRSITPGRCDLAPAAIRKALERYSLFDLDHHIDVRSVAASDAGDLEIASKSPEEALAPIRDAVKAAAEGRDAVVILGGDNGVTRPGVHGLGLPLDRCGLLTLDAHFDLRDTDQGLHNGNPIRALLKDGMPGHNISQVGIQPFANSPDYAALAVKADISFHSADQTREVGLTKLVSQELIRLGHVADAVYVDLDVDVLDRAFSPGTPGARPGGFTPAEVRRAAFVIGQYAKVQVLDLVEIDPEKDTNSLSAFAAASFVLSFASGLTTRHRSASH